MFRELILICGLLVVCFSFPDGAPADTCVKVRSNEPNHGAARTQPLSSLPYQVVASTDNYHPGSSIQVTISGHDVFRGFFIQARDLQTNEWVGEWQESPNTKTIPECASITHSDPRDKTQATLIWQAPQHKQGQVYFTGTIVKNYGTFFSGIIAQIPVPIGYAPILNH